MSSPEQQPDPFESRFAYYARKTGKAIVDAFKESWKAPERVELALDDFCMGNPDYEEGSKMVPASAVHLDFRADDIIAYYICRDEEHVFDWQQTSGTFYLNPLVEVNVSGEKALELLDAGAHILPSIERPDSKDDIHRSLVSQGLNRKDLLGSTTSRALEQKYGLDL